MECTVRVGNGQRARYVSGAEPVRVSPKFPCYPSPAPGTLPRERWKIGPPLDVEFGIVLKKLDPAKNITTRAHPANELISVPRNTSTSNLPHHCIELGI